MLPDYQENTIDDSHAGGDDDDVDADDGNRHAGGDDDYDDNGNAGHLLVLPDYQENTTDHSHAGGNDDDADFDNSDDDNSRPGGNDDDGEGIVVFLDDESNLTKTLTGRRQSFWS